MKRLLVVGLLLGSCSFAWANSPGELAQKAESTGVPLLELLADCGPLPENAANLQPLELQYLQYKLTDTPMPAWLWRSQNPPSGRDQGSRVGGDTDADAVEIDLSVGDEPYTDTGSTAGLVDHTTAACTIGGSELGCITASTNTAPDAWYSIDLDSSVTLVASLCGSSYDTKLYFFDSDLVMVAGNDDSCGLQSEIACLMPAGVYYIVVDGFSSNSGDYTLSVELQDVCADYEAGVLSLETIPGSITGSTVGAPDVIQGTGGDVGIEFSLSTSAYYDINSCLEGTDYGVDFYLYDDSPCEGGVLIASNDYYPSCSEHSYAARLRNLELAAGDYHLTVSNTGSAEGAFEIEIQPAPESPTSGGPDEFGYTWVSSDDDEGDPFEWIDIAETGSVLTLNDDAVTEALEIGFAFPYYDDVYTELYVSSNGYLGFISDGMTSLGSPGFPNVNNPNAVIAGFWDDLNPSGTSSVLYEAQPEEGRFIVQYNGIPPYSDPGNHYFQIVLYDSGDFHINMLDMIGDDLSNCAVGNENADGTIGLEVSYLGEGAILGDSLSFQFFALEGDFAAPLITHTPVESGEEEAANGYSVSADLEDVSGIQRATVYYRLDEISDPDSVEMTADREAWTGIIPQQTGGSTVYYWIGAWDNAERHNYRESEVWSFPVVSYQWPPLYMGATDGEFNRTLITWTPPGPPAQPDELIESFEAGIPGTWTMHSLDGTVSVWQQTAPGDVEGAVTGLHVAGVNQEEFSIQGDEYLMTQGLVMGAAAQLSFYSRASLSYGSTDFEVVISTSGNAEEDATSATILESINTLGTWTQHTLDLSAYSNQTVYIGWHFTGSNGYGLYIDDVHFSGLDVPVVCQGHRPNPGVVFPGRPELLARQLGVSTEQALQTILQWQAALNASRVFQEYIVYRDDIEIARTTDLYLEDTADLGSQSDVNYTYTVSALYDLGESDPSNADQGYWTGRPNTGGPDQMGYVWYSDDHPEGPAFEDLDISTMGNDLNLLGLDVSTVFSLPFEFFFYGVPYSQLTLASNGYLTFDTYGTDYTNDAIPNSQEPNNLIAVFWDDLNMPTTESKVYEYYDEDNGRQIFQWTNMRRYEDAQADLSFQAILYEDGNIILQYMNMQTVNLASATSGVEESAGTYGLQVHYEGEGGPVESGSAILIGSLEGDFMPPFVSHTNLPDVETEIEGDYTISAEITDNASDIASALLYYSTGGAYTELSMSNTTGDTYTAEIPHQDEDVVVDYYIEAIDASDNENTSTTETYSFYVISCEWAPQNIQASDGVLAQVLVTWTEPWLQALFGADGLRTPEELAEAHSWSKAEAMSRYNEMHRPLRTDTRQFLMYHVLRNGDEIGTTMDLSFVDSEETGMVAGTEYSYSVSAEYTACTSDGGDPDFGVASVPGGPDAFGYTWRTSNSPLGPSYDWTSIVGLGDNLNINGDDQQGSITLPFSFPFYGVEHTSANVSSNGYLSFSTSATEYFNQPLPNTSEPNDAVYGIWDDLTTSSGGSIYFYDDVENNRAILQWQDVPHLNEAAGPFTFQIILYPNGNILLQYESLGEGAGSCTVGIEDASGTTGLMYHHIGEIGTMNDELAVMFYGPINCEPVNCEGENEVEPNDGWDGDAFTANEIDSGDTVCGTIQMDGAIANADYYLYNHFGGGLVISTEMSDFDGVLRVLEAAQDGAVLYVSDEWERCGNESLAINGLDNGQYFIVVDHDTEDPAIEGDQTYSLSVLATGDPCDGHEPIVCEGTPEVEPNEGWNSDPASYNEIASGDTFCGTIAREEGIEESDWFYFTTSGNTDVRLSATVDEFDAVLFLTDFSPDGVVIADEDFGPRCYPEELFYQGLPAGEYYAVISCVDDEDFNAENYSLHLELNSSSMGQPCGDLIQAGDLVNEYSANRPAPTLAHQNGSTGCPDSTPSPGLDEIHVLNLTGTSNDIRIIMQGEGNADEVILLMADCANANSCGAAQDAFGSGAEAEVLDLVGLPAQTYYVVADFANPGESAAYTLTILDMVALDAGLVYDFELLGNHPNPFNPTTTIVWMQPDLAEVKLQVWNLLGEVVCEHRLGSLPAGRHEFRWDASELSSGLYIYRLEAGKDEAQGKLMLLK